MLRSRRDSREIERHTPQEVGIAAQLRRQQFHTLQLLVDERIDKAVFGRGLPLIALAIAEHRNQIRRIQTFVPHERRRFTASHRFDHAAGCDGRNFKAARVEHRIARHIARGAVRIKGEHDHLLCAVGALEDRLLGIDLDPFDAAILLKLAALGDPFFGELVVTRLFIEEESPFVRHPLSRLEQHQTLSRHRAIEPPSGDVIDQRRVIVKRVVTAQRELESRLPLLRTVTRSRVATDLTRDRNDLANEADRRCLQRLHRNRHFDRMSRHRHCDLRLADRFGFDEPIPVDADLRPRRRELHFARQVV